MKLVSTICQSCGATLEVYDEAHFVTCNYCDTPLELEEDDGCINTKLAKNVKELLRQTRQHQVEIELAKLDVSWNQDRIKALGGKLSPLPFWIMMIFGIITLTGVYIIINNVYIISTMPLDKNISAFWAMVGGIVVGGFGLTYLSAIIIDTWWYYKHHKIYDAKKATLTTKYNQL